MKRDAADRENPMREAVALVERVALRLPNEPTIVVAGFRANGALTVLFGEDPVYQFTSTGELRRAFRNGVTIKAEQGQLLAISKVVTAGQITLGSEALSASSQEEILSDVRQRLQALKVSLDSSSGGVLEQIPPEADVIARLLAWLQSHTDAIPIARSPHVR